MSLGFFAGNQARMKLSKRLAGDFSGTVRKRGNSYFWQGRVRIQLGSDSEIEARVRGSHTSYDVSLAWGGGVLSAVCGCPYFDSGGPCKHVWATILTAEERGYLSAAASSPNLILVCGDYDSDKELEEEEEGSLFSPRGPVAIQPRAPKPPTSR